MHFKTWDIGDIIAGRGKGFYSAPVPRRIDG